MSKWNKSSQVKIPHWCSVRTSTASLLNFKNRHQLKAAKVREIHLLESQTAFCC